ncbi:hypothetical protein D3C86_1406910 [compost metagenome]
MLAGAQARVGLGQLPGAVLDLTLQAAGVLLELARHVVEAGAEQVDLVAGTGQARDERPAVARSEALDGDDELVEARGEPEGDEEGEQHAGRQEGQDDHEADGAGLLHDLPEARRGGADPDDPGRLAQIAAQVRQGDVMDRLAVRHLGGLGDRVVPNERLEAAIGHGIVEDLADLAGVAVGDRPPRLAVDDHDVAQARIPLHEDFHVGLDMVLAGEEHLVDALLDVLGVALLQLDGLRLQGLRDREVQEDAERSQRQHEEGDQAQREPGPDRDEARAYHVTWFPGTRSWGGHGLRIVEGMGPFQPG